MTDNFDPKHHWETTVKHGEEILSLRDSTGRLEAGQEALRTSTRSGFDDIQHTLRQIRDDVKEAQRPPPPVPWVGIGCT